MLGCGGLQEHLLLMAVLTSWHAKASVGSDIRGGWGKDNGIVVGNDNCVILKFNPVKPRIINLRLSGRKLM
jgi:hypothetical protein